MLTKILSISEKPGLYRLVSTGKNLNIVESLIDGKRIPIYLTEKVIALSDVSIYTTESDVPLREVLSKIKEKENGEKASIGKKSSSKEIFAFFEEVLPTYDKDKVYASDVKKIISWYNALIDANIDFEKIESQNGDQENDSSEELDNNDK
ncbi:MAG: DUF5606 domain-containing protein [Proteiniphilum sp.]|nr:DUF5606 domain-containing protein [Proteiniphilum sp.]